MRAPPPAGLCKNAMMEIVRRMREDDCEIALADLQPCSPVQRELATYYKCREALYKCFPSSRQLKRLPRIQAVKALREKMPQLSLREAVDLLNFLQWSGY